MSFLPMLITMIINALVALGRIQGFLEREEAPQDKVGGERLSRIVHPGILDISIIHCYHQFLKMRGPVCLEIQPQTPLPLIVAQADQEGVNPGEIKVTDGEFVWDEKAENPLLSGVNFEAKPGTLTMIVGSVGSGENITPAW